MPIQTITVYFWEGEDRATAYAYALESQSVSGKGLASLTRDSKLANSGQVKYVTCSQRDVSVIVDPFTLETKLLRVYEIEVRLNGPTTFDDYVQVNVLDDHLSLGQLSWRSKFCAGANFQWQPNHGIRIQTFENAKLKRSGGLSSGQYRHNMGFTRDENSGKLQTIASLPGDVAEPDFQGPRLFFLGDENVTNGAQAGEWSELWKEFYDVVKKTSNGVAKVSLGGESTTDFFDQMMAELPNDRQCFDEWRFHHYNLRDETIEQWIKDVTKHVEWSQQQDYDARIVLGFSKEDNRSLSTETLDQAMAFIESQERIVEAFWWKFEEDTQVVASARLSNAGAVPKNYVLTQFGKDYRRLSFKYAKPSLV